MDSSLPAAIGELAVGHANAPHQALKRIAIAGGDGDLRQVTLRSVAGKSSEATVGHRRRRTRRHFGQERESSPFTNLHHDWDVIARGHILEGERPILAAER